MIWNAKEHLRTLDTSFVLLANKALETTKVWYFDKRALFPTYYMKRELENCSRLKIQIRAQNLD